MVFSTLSFAVNACIFNFIDTFEGSETGLGQLQRERAAEYTALKATEQGRLKLQQNLEEQMAKRAADSQATGAKAKDDRQNSLVRQLAAVCAQLEQDFGVHSVVLVAPPGESPVVIGSEKGRVFMNTRQDTVVGPFAAAMACDIPEVAAPQPDDDRPVLRQKVQLLLNDKYRCGTGTENGSIPYRAYAQNPDLLCVQGFPAGVSLQPPGKYGRGALRSILAAAADIKITKG